MTTDQEIYIHHCLRCKGGHTWASKLERPAVCPKCHSAWWDRPRKEKQT